MEIECGDNQEEETEIDNAEISVHAITSLHGPRTMKLVAWVKDRRVIILIDNGSSRNFINQTLANKLHLKATQVEPFKVKVASGEGLRCDITYKDIPIKVQGLTIRADLYALPLVGLDIILGVQWLEGLGQVVSDYGKGTMEFQWGVVSSH